MKNSVNRDGPDVKTRSAVAKSTRNGGFDGFLNTMLGKNQQGKSGASKSASPGGSAGRKAGQAGAGMKASDKEALKRSMDKTVSGEEAVPAEGEADAEQIAAAAEEAAMLIWNLLYGPETTGVMDACGSAFDSLAKLSDMIHGTGAGGGGSLSGMDGEVDLDAMQDAIETANASAEMNSAAVLAALDELLDGMPREALQNALSRTAGELGLPAGGNADMFNAIAEALNAEVTGVDTMSGSDLLAQLAAAVGGNNSPRTAESAGTSFSANDILQLFQQFIEESYDATDPGNPLEQAFSSDPEMADAMANSFVAWLHETGNSNIAKELPTSGNKFFDMLAAAAGKGGEGGVPAASDKISTLVQNLERALQSPASKTVRENTDFAPDENAKTLARSILGGNSETSSQPQSGQGVPGAIAATSAQVPQQQAAQAAQQNNQVSSMLDQIENIERLAEAMRMSRRNGINNITMQLSPAELGKVLVRVEARDGVVSAFLKVEKPEAASRLASGLGQLRETLKNMGIELGELDIQQRPRQEAMADFSDGRHGSERNAEPFEPDFRRTAREGGAGGTETDDSVVATVGTGNNGPGALNLFA